MTEEDGSPHRRYPPEVYREIYSWDLEHNPGGILGCWYLRRWSVSIIRLVAPLPVAPNHLTYGSLIAALGALVVLYHGFAWANVVAALLIQLCLVLGYADGDMVRLKHLGNRFGGWLDGVVDMTKITVVYFAVAVGGYSESGDLTIFLPLSLVIATRLILAHISHKTSSTFEKESESGLDNAVTGGRAGALAMRLGIRPEFVAYSDDIKFLLLTLIVLCKFYFWGLMCLAVVHALMIGIACISVWRMGKQDALGDIGWVQDEAPDARDDA
jgi:phosphatidylglycerophosphate synthase